MKVKTAASFPVSIFMAGGFHRAVLICREFCDDVGLCVTVTAATYVFSGGKERGFIVGLINYPRFPKSAEYIEGVAIQLGMKLREELRQESFSVQSQDKTTWFSWRAEDDAPILSGSGVVEEMWVEHDLGGISGSREPSPTVSALTGFDPGRLALLMEMEDDWVFYTAELADRSGLSVADCRVYLREFHAAGLARLTPVYCEDDSTVRGRGYSLTREGVEARIVAKNGGRQ